MMSASVESMRSSLTLGLILSFAIGSAPRPTMAQTLELVPSYAVASRMRALECLTQAVAYEAGYEPESGKQAVAEVVLNRVRSPLFPNSVCGVVFQGSERSTGCQFTFTCDGALRRRLPDSVMAESRAVAAAALDNKNPVLVAGALNYHADYVSPYWAPSLVRIAKIGRHIFYRLPGQRDAGAQTILFASGTEPDNTQAVETSMPAGAAQTSIVKNNQAFSPWGISLATPPSGR